MSINPLIIKNAVLKSTLLTVASFIGHNIGRLFSYGNVSQLSFAYVLSFFLGASITGIVFEYYTHKEQNEF